MNGCFRYLPKKMIRFPAEEPIILILHSTVKTCPKYLTNLRLHVCRQSRLPVLRWEFNTKKKQELHLIITVKIRWWFAHWATPLVRKVKFRKHSKWLR